MGRCFALSIFAPFHKYIPHWKSFELHKDSFWRGPSMVTFQKYIKSNVLVKHARGIYMQTDYKT